MITGMTNAGSIPVLERLVQFTGARHTHLTNNVANLSTPNYQPRDLSVDAFQKVLGEAVEQRRRDVGGPSSELKLRDTRQIKFGENGIETRAATLRDNILFHDRNNRSMEHAMKDLAENAMMHNAGLQMLKSKFSGIESAIREQA